MQIEKIALESRDKIEDITSANTVFVGSCASPNADGTWQTREALDEIVKGRYARKTTDKAT